MRGFEEASKKLEQLMAAERLFKAVILRTIVSNIRRRFLATMERALEIEVQEVDGKAPTVSIKQRMRDVALKNKIARGMEMLNDAQSEGDFARANKIRERLSQRYAQLVERLNVYPSGKRVNSSRLSVAAGNQFRRRMVLLLSYLTDAAFVGLEKDDSGLMFGIGPKRFMDTVETPSATLALTGTATRSRRKVLWRHLEFGTGIYRSLAKDRRNLPAPPPKTWWYGPEKGSKGMGLGGTEPMNFLLDPKGLFYAEDAEALKAEITKLFENLLSK